MHWSDENLAQVLIKGGVAVMPTDTIYGIVGSALNKDTVERIYRLRKRNPDKPCIILIGDTGELQKFGINLTAQQIEIIKNFSSPTSVILDCMGEKFSYLHRGTRTLAFRVLQQGELRELLEKTGPLIAPSANIEGLEPSKNIQEARNYFGNEVDIYIDGGEVNGKASKIIKLEGDGSLAVLRE